MKFNFIVRNSVKKMDKQGQCFFFSRDIQTARDTPLVEFFHGRFSLFTGILSKIITGKVKNFTGIFSKIITRKLEKSRAFRKIDVSGTLTCVTCTFVLLSQKFFNIQLSQHR